MKEIILTFSEESYKRFLSLKDNRNIDDDAELIREALALLELYSELMISGGKLLSYQDNTYQVIELSNDNN